MNPAVTDSNLGAADFFIQKKYLSEVLWKVLLDSLRDANPGAQVAGGLRYQRKGLSSNPTGTFLHLFVLP